MRGTATKDEWLAKRRVRWAEAFDLVEHGEASETTAHCVALVEEGFGINEIANRLHLSRSRAGDALRDPLGVAGQARRHKHHGICKSCGAETYNGGATGRPLPRVCRSCHREELKRATRQKIIDAIQMYKDRYGRPPTAWDWNVAHARVKAKPERLTEIEARWDDGRWPALSQVQKVFGTWNAAIDAAGFRTVAAGKPRGSG